MTTCIRDTIAVFIVALDCTIVVSNVIAQLVKPSAPFPVSTDVLRAFCDALSLSRLAAFAFLAIGEN